jgi:hypothetical protein
MSTYTATTKTLVLIGLFCMQIHGGVDAGSPFITPEFAIPEVLDDDEIFTDDSDSTLVKRRKPFFRKINNWGINNMIKTNPTPPPPPPETPPSPVPGTDPLVLDDEEADNTSNIVNESFEQSASRVNERDDTSVDENTQSGASSSSSSSEEKKNAERYFSFRRSGGRLGFEVQSSTVNGSKKKRSTPTMAAAIAPSTSRDIYWGSMDTLSSGNKMTSTKASATTTATVAADTDAIELSFDASSLCNLARLIANGTATTGFAVLGTLRLLAPMLLARRVLLYMLNVASDWYTGRYVRFWFETRQAVGVYMQDRVG